MAPVPVVSTSAQPARWRTLLVLPGLLAVLALTAAFFYYFTGDDRTFPVEPVAQLTAAPTALPPVRIGLAELSVRVNSYLLTQTFDVAGPYVQPDAALLLLLLLAAGLAGFLAVLSTLPRLPFVVGMGLVIFLLMSLNADLLSVFDSRHQYFFILALLALGLPAYGLHAFRPDVPLLPRLLLFGGLVAVLGFVLITRSAYSVPETTLHLASYFTTGSAVALGLLAVWVSFENIHGLLWLNTQAESPGSRFGLLPFLLASGLYLGMLLLYYLNAGELLLFAGLRLDPFVLLLPAVVVGWLGLRRRAATYAEWVPYGPAAHLYLLVVALAAGAVGYALATANDPWLTAGREFVALMLLTGGVSFLIYVLLNFAPLIRQRLRVYRVVYEPRRMPFYAVYLLALGSLAAVEARNDFPVLDQVRAAYYNNLGDLTRLQSELRPEEEALALLAERYYAESDVLDRYNRKAGFGRAALYRFRAQRQNEINALRRALSRQPSAKLSVRLAALYAEPGDFFERLQVLREGLRAHPRSAFLANDLAQLYTRTNLPDSVEVYQAVGLAAHNPTGQANRLAFLLQQQQWAAAQALVAENKATATDPAFQSNALLLSQLTHQPLAAAAPPAAAHLTASTFGQLYHLALRRATARDTTLLPLLTQAAQSPDNAAYAEQLDLLRALTHYYGGAPVAAQTTLLPLAAGTSPGAAYYQQLAGMWLLEQKLYASAAVRLDGAAWIGATDARLPLAYAYALSGRPDSARTVAQRVAAKPDGRVSRPAARLVHILTLDFNHDYALASDSVKAQYLVLRGGNLPPADLLPCAVALAEPAAREAALLAQLPRALAVGQTDAARAVIQRFAPAPTLRSDQASAWNVVRGQLAVRTGDEANLDQLLRSAWFSPAARPDVLYYRAALATLTNKPAAAAQAYGQLVREAPFLEAGVLAAAGFYTDQHNFTAAYQALQQALSYNPESGQLHQAYALAAVKAGLAGYATASLDKLRTLLSPAEYATFHARYAAQVAAASIWK